MTNFFCNLFSLFIDNSIWMERMKLNSLFRSLIRSVANISLPLYYKLTKRDVVLSPFRESGEQVIVSLTSFPGRIHKVWLVVETLFRQTQKPDHVCLYLSKDQFPNRNSDLPKRLLKQTNRGLEIFFVEGDIRSHKKYFYAMKAFPHDLIVTVDDDIFYPSSLVQELLDKHKQCVNAVVCRYVRELKWDAKGALLPRKCWPFSYSDSLPSQSILFGSGGGTLFPCPSKSLHQDTLNPDLFLAISPLEDDLWLNAMTRLQGTPIVATIKYNYPLEIKFSKNSTLFSQNGGDNLTDKQINQIIAHYSKIGLTPFAKTSQP